MPVVTANVGQPTGPHQTLENLVEAGLAVAEHDRAIHSLLARTQRVQPGQHAGKHGVTRRLGRQRDEHTTRTEPGSQNLRRRQRCLGLALAHRGLDDHQPRCDHLPGNLAGNALHGAR